MYYLRWLNIYASTLTAVDIIKKAISFMVFVFITQVGHSWNPIVLELQEWLRFRKEVEMGSI